MYEYARKPGVGLATRGSFKADARRRAHNIRHEKDESTLNGLMLYQISPVSDRLATKKVACLLLLGDGEPWPVRFVYTPFLSPLVLHGHGREQARSRITWLEAIAAALCKHTS
jgi:hypothetical protein